MSAPEKIRYHVSLKTLMTVESIDDVTVRTLTRADVHALAELMLDAYTGTIDYEGETIDEAVGEVESWFDGSPLLDHSYVAIIAGVFVSAVLVMTLDGLPFIAIVMTRGDSKDQGLGRYVTATALASLRDKGEEQAGLFITRGNMPSEKLFLSLDAIPQPS